MNRASKQPQGRKLFSFVVVADTHVNESDTMTRSPFASNVMANDRARHVFAEIAAMSPAPQFVVHLGDIVHPAPAVPTFEEAAARFKDIARMLPVPLHLVPGNHDIGEKNLDGVPAEIVNEEFIAQYQRIFGADYFAFEHAGFKFIVINAFLFNSGLPAEQVQKDWIDREIGAAGGRVFVFSHYPPYLCQPAEAPMYDTMDEPARGWLLDRLRNGKVEAMFTGHVHNFWYDVVGGAEMYLLPSTAFLRHDYTEFYRIHPGEEHGRCDREKLGYLVVDVHESGHVAHLVRTHGQTLPAGRPPAGKRFAPRIHTKTSPLGRFGVEMRHAWSEIVEIPCTGGIEEFGRKRARNDYQLMALWEAGVRTLKVPEQDLCDASIAARARLMSDVGHDFIMTSLGVPGEALVRDLAASGVRLGAIEVNLPLQKFLRHADEAARLRKASSAKVIFSKLRTTEDAHFDGQHFSHFVNAGLQLAELEPMAPQLAALVKRGSLDGITVRLDRGTDLVAAAAQLDRFGRELGCEILASVKLSHKSLAGIVVDDPDTARMAAEAIIASKSSDRVHYVFDTFMDIDRGYFPRNGFIDRRFNPRPAAFAVASLAATLPPGAARVLSAAEVEGCRAVSFEAGGRRFSLLFGTAEQVTSRLGKDHWSAAVDLITKEVVGGSDQDKLALQGADRALVCVEHVTSGVSNKKEEEPCTPSRDCLPASALR